MDPANPPNVLKGDRIRASWMAAHITCLAGVQTKFGATVKTVTGTVRHIRVDHPVAPTEMRLFIDPDEGYDGPYLNPPGCTCGTKHVEIRPQWVEARL